MWILAVAGWVGVVIAGSALTWIAITRAGDQVTRSRDGATTEPAVVATLGTAPTSTEEVRPSLPATPPASSVSPATVAPAAPTSPPRVATPRAHPTPPGPSALPVRTETRTWTGSSGFVTVSCTGREAQLRGASPNDRWSYEVGEASGESVEVTFKRDDEEVQVKASCSDGTPQFRVETGGD